MLSQVSKKSRLAEAHQKKPTRFRSGPRRAHTVSGIVTRSVVGLMVVGLLFSGCATVGPDFVRPKAPGAKEWIEKFQSYTEYSPSKTGTHTIVKGKLPCEKGIKKGDYEIYDYARYFTFTGDVIET